MKIIKFEPSTTEEEIFKKLRGKHFFAIWVEEDKEKDNSFHYHWHLHDLPPEIILFGMELLKRHILKTWS